MEIGFVLLFGFWFYEQNGLIYAFLVFIRYWYFPSVTPMSVGIFELMNCRDHVNLFFPHTFGKFWV